MGGNLATTTHKSDQVVKEGHGTANECKVEQIGPETFF